MVSNLRQDRRAAEAAWARFATAHTSDGARHEIGDSWLRSAGAGALDCSEAPMADEVNAAVTWRDSPVRQAVEGLRDELDAIAADGFIVAVTDADGVILQTHGGRWMRSRAERVNFAPGGRWDERSMGTNALGLSLATGRPSTVFSAEHLSAAVHGWVCYAAPIVDGDGHQLGVLDLSTTWDRANPLALTTARTMALLISAHLPRIDARTLELRLLGSPRVRLGGATVHLSPRQTEILAVIALHPEGIGLEALHAAVWPGLAEATLGTCKAEVSHLRQRLPGILDSRPYRLREPAAVDAVEVLRLVRAGRVAEATRWYGGELLPGSDAPALVEHRHVVTAAVRSAVLASGDAEALLRLGEVEPADRELQAASLALLAPADPRAALPRARLRVMP